MFDRLFVALQFVLPTRLLGRVVYRATRSRVRWFKNTLIRAFVAAFPVDVTEMDTADTCDYESFNAFFTRNLAPNARPVDPNPAGICCPADGTVQQLGPIADGRLLQVKGLDYRLDQLLGVSPADAARFDGGVFLTIYLAPHNYHRVHAPSAGRVRRMNFIPGALFSVNETTARHIPGLFARNERVACYFSDGPADYWLVFVGAMNVASISTAWAGEITAQRTGRQISYDDAEAFPLAKGDYAGHFNMGSTVIVVYPPESVIWDHGLAPGDPLTAGREIGRR